MQLADVVVWSQRWFKLSFRVKAGIFQAKDIYQAEVTELLWGAGCSLGWKATYGFIISFASSSALNCIAEIPMTSLGLTGFN